MPRQNDECGELHDNYIESGDPDTGNDILQTLNEVREDNWMR